MTKDLRCAICTKTWDEHKTVITHDFKHDPRPKDLQGIPDAMLTPAQKELAKAKRTSNDVSKLLDDFETAMRYWFELGGSYADVCVIARRLRLRIERLIRPADETPQTDIPIDLCGRLQQLAAHLRTSLTSHERRDILEAAAEIERLRLRS